MSRMGGGHRTPSLMGSKQSVYSHTSSAVRTYKSGPKSHKSHKSVSKWYMKPIMKSAIYTDLQRGAWHIAFYTLVSQIVFKEEKNRQITTVLYCLAFDSFDLTRKIEENFGIFHCSFYPFGPFSHPDSTSIAYMKPIRARHIPVTTSSVSTLSMLAMLIFAVCLSCLVFSAFY